MKTLKSLLFAIALLVSTLNYAQTNPNAKFGVSDNNDNLKGLTVGDTAPNFNTNKKDEKNFNLYETLENNQVILVFYRGYWCGYCNQHLAALEEELGQLQNQGISVVAVTPESEDGINKTIEKTKASFPIISDTDGSIMKNYGVLFNVSEDYQAKLIKYIEKDIRELNSSKQAVLPIPATYIIGKDKTIKKAFYNPDYSVRSTINDIKAALAF